jgi:octanoyl-[GcvH]:protein N-octanoyltransferase
MNSTPLTLIKEPLSGSASLDTAISRAVLMRVSDGHMGETLQIGIPHKVVAFGKHDSLAERFPEAVAIADDHGFDPAIRIAGGRAVVFHPKTVRFAWTIPADDPVIDLHARFIAVANHLIAALAGLGVEAEMGELDGEYCAGSYSVHLANGGKVMGSGQRLSRKAAQVGGMIVVGDRDVVNDVLVPIYEALGVDMDPTVTGHIESHKSVDVGTVASAFSDQFAQSHQTRLGTIDAETMELALRLQPDHEPRRLA